MINILFGGNYKVFDGILLCLMSAIKHCDDKLNVYILTADVSTLNKEYIPLTASQIEILNNIVKEKNPLSNVTLIMLDEEFNDWVMSSTNRNNSYTPFAFLRLFADTVDLPNKIIYLDTDIMLNGNIKELMDTDISNHEMAVVLDRYGRFFIKPNYFNSGVILMNMAKIKESGLLKKVRNFCSKKKMGFPDQSALNKFCKNKIYLPRKFNEQGKLRNNTIIHHFSKKIKWFPIFHTINIKPWHIEDVQNKYKCHVYDDIYKEYLKIKN